MCDLHYWCSSAGIYKGSALNLWWLYSGVFTPDEYYNIVQSTGAGTRRDVVVEEIQQQQQQQQHIEFVLGLYATERDWTQLNRGRASDQKGIKA